MKYLLRWTVVLPILTGIAIGGLLFAVGALEDAPGMCAIGLSIGFVLIMLGINNTGIIKKGLLAPILLFCFGTFAVLLTTALLLDKEFGNRPWLSLIGYAVAFALLLSGTHQLKAFHKAKQQQDGKPH